MASGWAGIEVNGPAALVSWAAGEERKKEKREKGSWAGLDWFRGKRNVLPFWKTILTHLV